MPWPIDFEDMAMAAWPRESGDNHDLMLLVDDDCVRATFGHAQLACRARAMQA